MKNKSKQQNTIKKLLISAAVVAVIYTLIHYLYLPNHMMYGIWIAIGSLLYTVTPEPSLSISFAYASQFSMLLAPTLILGFVLAVFRQSSPFKVAFISTMITHPVLAIAGIFLSSVWIERFIVPLFAMFAAYILTILLLKRVNKSIFIWAIAVSLFAMNLTITPMVANRLSRSMAEDQQTKDLELAVKNIKFTAYYPSYVPEGLAASDAKLEGYRDRRYQHQHVSYQIGKLEIMMSEKLKNQDAVFNKTDNCDISSIMFEMKTKDEIPRARVERSRDNLSVCRVLGATQQGYNVYVEANSRSQFEFYYMEIDNTVVVMQHNKLLKPRYPEGFENEILKIYNSMNPIENSSLKPQY